MAKISITNASRDIQAIIEASKPRDRLIFKRGIYLLKEPLQFKNDRRYISHSAVFVKSEPFDEFMIKLAGEPLPPRTFFQRIADYVRHFLHLPPRISTLIRGFILIGAGMRLMNTERCVITECMVVHSADGLRFSE